MKRCPSPVPAPTLPGGKTSWGCGLETVRLVVAGSEDKSTCSDFRRKDENRKLPPKPLSPKAADLAVNSLRAKAGAPRGGLSPLWF